jgi:hypothetical protein
MTMRSQAGSNGLRLPLESPALDQQAAADDNHAVKTFPGGDAHDHRLSSEACVHSP